MVKVMYARKTFARMSSVKEFIWRQQEHFQERKLPKGCMPERRLQECQMSNWFIWR